MSRGVMPHWRARTFALGIVVGIASVAVASCGSSAPSTGPETGSIHGQLELSIGTGIIKGVEGTVTFESSVNVHRIYHRSTDSSGRFAMTLAVGAWVVSATSPSFEHGTMRCPTEALHVDVQKSHESSVSLVCIGK